MKRKSVLFLLIANSLPLLGVLFFNWSIFGILFLYWSENIIIGFFNVLRMFKSEADSPNKRFQMEVNNKPKLVSRAELVRFFILHYGLFTVGHGVAVFALFGPFTIHPLTLSFVMLGLFVSHGISYIVNFVGNDEYKKVSVKKLFAQPYKRIVAIHLVVVLGGTFINSLGAPLGALIVMIIVKTIFDMFAHVIERQKFSSV